VPPFRVSGSESRVNAKPETLNSKLFRCEQTHGKHDAKLASSQVFRKGCVMTGEFLGSKLESRLKKRVKV
jgi:hypothetical protein